MQITPSINKRIITFIKICRSGFSLVEVLVSVMIISILMLGVYNLINVYLRLNADNASIVAATEIANQRMERIRNLPYDQVGTIAGSPSGSIPQTETVIREGTFTVLTQILYYQDPYDGLVPPADIIFDDYKIATINVSWDGKYGPKKITLFSKIIPRTMETSSGNGIFILHIVDADGDPVGGANVHIENTQPAPFYVNTDLTSATSGIVYFSAPPAFEDYRITVTKPGYGVDRTYDRAAPNLNPSRPHLTIVAGDKTEESFEIDLLSTLRIKTITQDLPANWEAKNDLSGEAQANSRLAFDSAGFVYVVWQDFCCSADSKIHAQKYDDDGNPQWTEQTIGTANNTVFPDIRVDQAGNLYLAWADDAVGDKEVYLISLNSADGTDRWGGEKKLNPAWSSDQMSARIALLEKSGTATTSLVWVDNENGDFDIFLHNFDNAGDPEAAPAFNPNRTVNNAISDGKDQIDPEIAGNADDESFIVWTDNRNGNLDIYGAKFDTGRNYAWTPTNILMNNDGGSSAQYQADIDVDSLGNIFVVWTDERNGNADIYMQKYDTNGAPEWPSDKLVNSDSGSENQTEPSIAIDDLDNFYITWTDLRNGNKDIYAQKFNSGGDKLWPADLRVNIGIDAAAQYTSEVTIHPISQKPYATWIDERSGDPDVYITEFDAYGASSSLPNIAITVTGTKKIGESPVIYEYDIATTTDTNGFRQLTLEWDSPGYTLGVSSTVYSLIFAEPTMPALVLPNSIIDVTLFLD